VSRVDLLIPDIGNFSDVAVVDVLVKPGDHVDIDSPLLTLETDKASMDVPATAAGTIAEVLLKRGDKVSKGALIARVEASAPAASPAAAGAPAAGVAPAAEAASAAPAARPESAGDTVRITRRGKPVAQITAVQMPRRRIDLSALRAMTDTMPLQRESARDLLRRLRDEDRY